MRRSPRTILRDSNPIVWCSRSSRRMSPHKSDVGAVVFVPNEVDTVKRRIKELIEGQRGAGAEVAGVLIVEFVDTGGSGFGQELFVGLRSTP